MNILWKIVNGQQSSFSLGFYVKGIARAFNGINCLGGFLYLKPTAGCQISTLIFGFFRRPPYILPMKNWQWMAKFSSLALKSKVLPGPLTDLSAWVGFCTSSPKQGVKYQLWYLNFVLWRGLSINISYKYIKDDKVLAHLRFKSKVLPGPLADLSAWVGFSTSSLQQGVKYQLWYAVKYHALGYSLLYK